MGGIQKKERTRFREYNDWWNSVHLLRCDAEDFAAGRNYSSYTKNSLSRNLLLKRAFRIIAGGIRLLRSGLIHDKRHWEHLMLRSLQSYVTIRDRKWRFTVHDQQWRRWTRSWG